MVAGHGGRTLPAGGDRRTRLVFMVRTWRRAASARHALTPRHTRVARPGSIQLPEPDFPAESRRLSLFYVFIAATFLALAGARPLPAQAQAQCRENKRTPAPINRAHRQRADSGHAEHSRPSFGMHRLLSAAVRYQTADPQQRMDSNQQTADGGQWAEGCEQGAPVGCGHRTAGSE